MKRWLKRKDQCDAYARSCKIDYETNTYEVTEKHQHGEQIAKMVGANVEEVYKTLVLENANHEHFVFVIPVNASLDMKQART